MMVYLNFQHGSFPKETVDQFDTMKEARAMLQEYEMVGGGRYWLSSRCCANWKETAE